MSSAIFRIATYSLVPDFGDSIPSDHHLRTALLLSAAVGLTIASVLWRLPQIERLEAPPAEPEAAV